MSGVRYRRPSENGNPAADHAETVENPPPINTSTRSYAVIALIFAALVFLFFQTPQENISLPNVYALCSKEGLIYTVDDWNPTVECLVVSGRRILHTGTLEHVMVWNDRRQASELKSNPTDDWKIFFTKPGSIVVPGLADAHAHVIEYGMKRQLDLDGSTSMEDVLSRVKAYITSHPDVLHNKSAWIDGMGWDQTRWPTAQFPTAKDLDADPVLRDRLIHLRRVDAHASWVSPRVLQLMGALPDIVQGGEIVRDELGDPTGIMIDNAILLIPVPAPTEQQMLQYFRTTMEDALEHGLTSIHDAWSTPPMINFFAKMAEEQKLPLRLYLMGNVESDIYWGDQIPKLTNYGPDRRLNLRSIKLFADGALGSWGAALLRPYSDKPDSTGILRSKPRVLASLIKRFWMDDFQVNVHCIGDRANKLVLDTFEELLSSEPADAFAVRRPRIEHAQIMQLDDLERTGRLGVIASVQPTHATSDMWYAESRLGPKRIKGAYAYQSLLNASRKNVLPIGSDFPVERVNPLLGFYAAVSRLSVEGTSPHGHGGWYPNQRLTRAQALKGMTLDAAYASFAENELGSLSPGKFADFVVLDRDIMTIPVSEILKTKVQATAVDGRLAYGSF